MCFYQQFMAEKNFPFQLNLTKCKSKSNTKPNIYSSMINAHTSEVQKTERYIPMEFREKRDREEEEGREKGNNLSFIAGMFKKEQDRRRGSRRGSAFTHVKQKSENICQQIMREDRKILQKQIIIQIPKLRETNSTYCQSPKAVEIHHTSKLSDFHKLHLLGRGRFGDVFLVKHNRTGFIAALKIIKKRDLLIGSQQQNTKCLNQLVRQIKIQAYMNHPNLIKLYEFFSDSDCIYLLLELACDGHLFTCLQKSYKFGEETTSIIVRQIVAGVDYMHKHDVIHRDIKLENIVLAHGMAKICDFGWSVHCPKQFRSTMCGTPLYLSPEILIGQHYNRKIDTWAIGALTYELVTSENAFKIKHKEDLMKIITEDFQMQTGSVELRSFITFILRKNPSKRPDTDTIRRHPYLEKYKDLQTSEQLCRVISKNK